MKGPEHIEPDTRSHGTRFAEALPTAVRWSHALLAPRLRAGDQAVDATAGNGHDTLFLAQHVLPGGRVFAFDRQAEAIGATKSRISKLNPDAGSVELIHAGHERLAEFLPANLKGGVRAFMFNLGWLPGSDKTCITRADTTLAALQVAVEWLSEGGLITVVCYPGHEGGDAEARAVDAWAAELSATAFEAQKIAFLNLEGRPPHCLVVRRRPRLTSRKSA